MGKLFATDFETTTDENDCRVWAYSICEIGNPDNFMYGNSIDDFINWCANKKENYTCYFHNLKFDGEYIFSYLLTHGYKLIKDKKFREDKTFTTLISDMGQFYSIEIYFEVLPNKVNKVRIFDSLKILNFSVSQIAKSFNLPIRKLELDYKAFREVGHKLTEHEIDYIRNDVEIMARALEIMFNNDLKKMTIGGDALYNYKLTQDEYRNLFPILPYEVDSDIRQSYKGGFTYLNDKYVEKHTGCGVVFDVNSLYPSVMHYEKLPYGQPVYFKGKYFKNPFYPLYVQSLSCSFKVKKGKIPSIQIKNSLSFMPNDYLKSSDGEIVTLCLTSVDLELFLEQYDVEDITYHSGWMFKGRYGMFNQYIDGWTEQKIQAKKNGNKAMYQISKLMLNSLYGKFGLNPKTRSKYPYLKEDGRQ